MPDFAQYIYTQKDGCSIEINTESDTVNIYIDENLGPYNGGFSVMCFSLSEAEMIRDELTKKIEQLRATTV